jgi:DNA invertase Pin-like site-specific DNA recombinase
MLTILFGIIEFERDLILQRTNEGRVRAMAEGTKFGRKPKMTRHQQREALKRVAIGEPLRENALSYNVDHSTISRLKARHACGALIEPGVVFADRRGHTSALVRRILKP